MSGYGNPASAGGRRFWTIWKYISREFFLSFMVAFLFFFVIFFINQLLLMAEDILSRSAPPLDVLLLVIFAMPAIIAMSFPFGSLVGALMSAGRLAADNEILVLKSSGFSTGAIFAPFIALGLAFSVFSFVMNDFFLPLGTINYSRIYRKLITSAPALELKPYSVKRYKDTTIVTGAFEDGAIRDILVLDATEDGNSRMISAGRSWLSSGGDEGGFITLAMEDVFVQESNPRKPEQFEYSSVEKMDYNIILSKFTEALGGIGPSQMSSVDVWAVIEKKTEALDAKFVARDRELFAKSTVAASLYAAMSRGTEGLDASLRRLNGEADGITAIASRPIRDRALSNYKLEFYKKFSIPFGALCFVFLSFPLGSMAKKSGKAVGFISGLIIAVLYWGLLIGGQTVGLRTDFPPFWAMWIPNVFVLSMGLLFFVLEQWRR